MECRILRFLMILNSPLHQVISIHTNTFSKYLKDLPPDQLDLSVQNQPNLEEQYHSTQTLTAIFTSLNNLAILQQVIFKVRKLSIKHQVIIFFIKVPQDPEQIYKDFRAITNKDEVAPHKRCINSTHPEDAW